MACVNIVPSAILILMVAMHSPRVAGISVVKRSEAAPDCKYQADAELPIFCTPGDLHSSPKWLRYLSSLYGQTVDDVNNYPIDLKSFWILDSQLLLISGLDLNAKKHSTFINGYLDCPTQPSEIYQNMSNLDMLGIDPMEGGTGHDPPGSLWLYHPPPYSAIPSDTKVEVSHCGFGSLTAKEEEFGYWMYFAPGSGVFYDVGNTKAFQTHRQAVAYFLPQEECKNMYCKEHYTEMVKVASKSFTSIQFLSHGDSRCGLTSIEILDVQHSGADVCGLPGSWSSVNHGLSISAGLRGQCQCQCKKGQCVKCTTTNMKCQHSLRRTNPVPDAKSGLLRKNPVWLWLWLLPGLWVLHSLP